MSQDTPQERALRAGLGLAALLAAAAPLMILAFLAYFSWPLLTSGLLPRFFTQTWNPAAQQWGLLPMMLGTVWVAGLAMLWAAPLGIGLALHLVLFAPRGLARLLQAVVEFMTGIPTVVYAFAALFLLVPRMRGLLGGSGFSILTASLVLALVVVPTITLVARERLEAVPRRQVQAALAAGADRWQLCRRVLLPGAWKGLVTALVLGSGRAVGDTLIALMLAGNSLALPTSWASSGRTLTSHIALIFAADFASPSFKAVFLCGLILFLYSLALVVGLRLLQGRRRP